MSDNFYLKKYGIRHSHLAVPVPDDLKIIVVIPCYDEDKLIVTLESVFQSEFNSFSAEVITVINASESDTSAIKAKNEETLLKAKEWAQKATGKNLRFHFLLENNLPSRHAGVGLARKIGMDEAVFRFAKTRCDGIILCADADAVYDTNYLQQVHDHFFVHNPSSCGCSIYFEHPLSGKDFEPPVYEAIKRYELYLRYYKNALRYAGFPYAYHTIGSAMAVRSSAYQKSGGMNKRKAGEDFYFLQKIIESGNFTELFSTVVKPSPRPSHRVPFGTGRAVSDWLSKNEKEWNVYSVSIFDELKKWNSCIESLYSNEFDKTLKIHPLLYDFLISNGVEEKISECRKYTTGTENFRKRFYRWFNAFLVLKAAHFLRDNGMGSQDIVIGSGELLKRFNRESDKSIDVLLSVFRSLDKN